VDGHDPSRGKPVGEDLVPGLLERAVPDDRVPDRVGLEELADALAVGDLDWGRRAAMTGEREKPYREGTERISFAIS
jgi:hypothetical protein